MATALKAPRPASPPGHPLLGHLSELRRDWLGTLTRYARQYGDFVPIRIGPTRSFLLSDPELIESMLVASNRHLVKSPIIRTSRRLLGRGLVTSEGSLWRRQRRLMQPAFHRARLAAYGAAMVEAAERRLASWHDGERLDVHAEMMALTLEIVARVLFGAEVAGDTAAIGTAVGIAIDRFNVRMDSALLFMVPDTWPLPGNRSYLRAARRLDRVVYRMIDERRQSGEDRGDLLSLLLQARDEESGQGMDDQQLRDEVMTLFLAGHETTAIALSWTWYLLARHPEAAEKLRAELASVLGGRPPTVDDLPRLTYAERVVTESMRLQPPVWTMTREVAQACRVGEHDVPRGAMLLASQWVVHRDPRFFERPEAFEPDRWAGGLARRLPRFAYFPFGGGPRQCIGNGFATMETILVLATMAQRCRLELATDRPIVPLPSLTLRPKGGVPMVVKRR